MGWGSFAGGEARVPPDWSQLWGGERRRDRCELGSRRRRLWGASVWSRATEGMRAVTTSRVSRKEGWVSHGAQGTERVGHWASAGATPALLWPDAPGAFWFPFPPARHRGSGSLCLPEDAQDGVPFPVPRRATSCRDGAGASWAKFLTGFGYLILS